MSRGTVGVLLSAAALLVIAVYATAPRPAAIVAAAAQVAPAAPVVASAEYRYDAPPSISRETYAAIYCEAGSAACDEAGAMYDVLVAAGIDPAIQAGQATHETSLGTAGVGNPAIKNLHGVQCHGGDNRIADSPVGWGNGCAGIYESYTASVETWARLIAREYLPEGRNTPALVVAKYAPAGADGNSPPAYIASMQQAIDAYRGREPAPAVAEAAPPAPLVAFSAPASGDGPSGNPLNDPRTVLTQGYGVGTHAPAAVWGGVDLAWSDVAGAPIYATMDGEAVQSVTGTCGNGVEILAPGWRLLHCHLSAFGAAGPVRRGDIIGYVGSSGYSSGPHLHFEVWRDGVNVNPCDYQIGVC